MARAKKSNTNAKKSPTTGKTGTKKLPFHAFWSGALSFGLVNVPVLVFPASRHGGVRLRLLSPRGTALERRFYCPAHEKELAPEELVRGYELDDGSYVLVEDRELEAAEPEKSREIALREFVDFSELPPSMLERGYYLTPQRDAVKAYRLLAETMERTKRAGIATFVMRDREYLVAIFAQGGILCAETLRFHDELRTPATIGLPAIETAPRPRVTSFARAIDALEGRSLPAAELNDVDAQKLEAIIARKLRARKDVVQTTHKTEAVDPENEEDVDLLETIRMSLKQAGSGASPRRPAARSRAVVTTPKPKATKRSGGKASRPRPGKH